MLHGVIQTLLGAAGSLGFALLYNVHGKKLIYATLGGVMSWGSFLLFGLLVENEAVRYLIATAILMIYAELMARALKCPATVLLVSGWIPLIPGGGLYRTISCLVGGDMAGFAHTAADTILLMVAMSAGMRVGMTLMQITRVITRGPLMRRGRGDAGAPPADKNDDRG